MRGKHSEKASQWKNKEHLNEFTHFRMNTDPAMLVISDVEEKDEGDYRCRVDFIKSPTRNSRIYLTIIEGARDNNLLQHVGCVFAPSLRRFIRVATCQCCKYAEAAPFFRDIKPIPALVPSHPCAHQYHLLLSISSTPHLTSTSFSFKKLVEISSCFAAHNPQHCSPISIFPH
ncbi:synaptogenesis protein syg-2-like isoform X6 [Vespula squamosa]|uniref:Synaptogenesis protein syg-2-like isoform X6 n=1 Tax=Vespula squamosa TaxID=30214 RepID=A0ABD2AC94_VESSQ